MKRLYDGRVRSVRTGPVRKLLFGDAGAIESDTRYLIEDARNFGDFGDAFGAVRDRVIEACSDSAIAPPLSRCISALVNFEAASLGVEGERFSDPFEMRRRARAISQFKPYAEDAIAAWGDDLDELIGVVAKCVPRQSARQGFRLEAPLIEVVGSSMRLLDELVALVLSWHDDNERYSVRPGSRTAWQVKENVLAISRLSEEQARKSPGRVVEPSASKLSVSDAAARYFAGTPLVRLLLDTKVPIVISDQQISESGSIIARIGHGKSQTCEDLFKQLVLERGPDAPAMIIIDSQKDLIERLSRLKYFAPGQPGFGKLILVSAEHQVALNIFDFGADRLAALDEYHRNGIRNRAIQLLKDLFGSLLSAGTTQRQDLVLQFLMDVMVDMDGASMDTLKNLLREPTDYLAEIESCSNVDAIDFLTNEFTHDGQYRPVRKELLRRVWGALASPLKPMLTAPKTRLDLGWALQNGKIILVDTDKQHLSAEYSSLFGKYALMMAKMAVWQRANIPKPERREAIVLIDEAHEYASKGGDEAMEDFVLQARKYKVGMIFASQKLDKFSKEMQGVIAGQVGFKLCGAVSADDADKLAANMGISKDMLLGLERKDGSAEWALHVRNGGMAGAVKVDIAAGALNDEPNMTEDEWQAIVARNQERYGVEKSSRVSPSVPAMEPDDDDWRS